MLYPLKLRGFFVWQPSPDYPMIGETHAGKGFHLHPSASPFRYMVWQYRAMPAPCRHSKYRIMMQVLFILSIAVLAYLSYVLVKPEKF